MAWWKFQSYKHTVSLFVHTFAANHSPVDLTCHMKKYIFYLFRHQKKMKLMSENRNDVKWQIGIIIDEGIGI